MDAHVADGSALLTDLERTAAAEYGTLRHVAAEHAARRAAEAAADRLRRMVGGLAAIVWEVDARTWECTFISDGAEELLGYPPSQWLGSAELWHAIIHPEDREEALRTCRQGTASGCDYDFSYRAIAADGRVVWLHDVVHVVCDADGTARQLQGVLIDITEQKRREHAAELLAEAGRLLAAAGTVEEKLTAVADLVVGVLGDSAVVRLRGDDGLLRAVAAAPEAATAAMRTLDAITVPDELTAAFRAGRAFVLPQVSEKLLRAATRSDEQYRLAAEIGRGSVLAVPLTADGRLVGSLMLATTPEPRQYDDPDLALANDLGQRIAAMLAAERLATRQRQLQQITTALACAESLQQVGQVLVDGLAQAFGASGQSVYSVDPEWGGLRMVHAVGYPTEVLQKFAALRSADPVPIAEVARTGEPIWLRNRDDWQARYPHLVKHAKTTGNQAAATLPLRVAGKIVGVIAASFPTPREFPPDEREFALTLVGQAAQAFQRAAAADEQRDIAETLQRSLLPSALPDLHRVGLATHYLPATSGTQAGGDWYDVLTLDADRVAVVVGDVVGHGPPAAAVMGQLRSALAAYVLDGHGPAAALRRLNHFAQRVAGATASTAICLVLDTRTGKLRWSRAGHPPPLVLSTDGARYLDDAHGPVLGVCPPPPFTEGHATLQPGASVLLYTDGLVERRGEVIDDGLARLAAAAAPHAATDPEHLIRLVLEQALDGAGPADDVALIVARMRPAS